MRYVLFALLGVLIFRLASFLMAVAGIRRVTHPPQTGSPQAPGQDLVKDPNCTVYVSKERALRHRIDGEIHYFCGEACRDQYTQLVAEYRSS